MTELFLKAVMKGQKLSTFLSKGSIRDDGRFLYAALRV